MNCPLPSSILVLERGWLSANSILLFAGDRATVIDSGYVTHADQTVALVGHALSGRRLDRLINTHSHSDHIGGNAALHAAYGCAILVPVGMQAMIADWNQDALLLSPLGQQGARFQHDNLIAAGQELEMGGLNWQVIAVPGHDMDALAYFNPEQGILISGDALWENGFGVIFPELLGQADGLSSTRSTLENLARLPIRTIIPGHGRPFINIDQAFQNAFRRLDHFEKDIEKLAWHAIKVIVAFALLEKQQIKAEQFADFVLSLPFAVDVNKRYLDWPLQKLLGRLEGELCLAGAAKRQDGYLIAG